MRDKIKDLLNNYEVPEGWDIEGDSLTTCMFYGEDLELWCYDRVTGRYERKKIDELDYWNEVTLVESHGGEGQGEDYWTVWKFVKDGEEEYVQFYGYYYSYDGATYEGYCFVKPKQVQRTEWVNG